MIRYDVLKNDFCEICTFVQQNLCKNPTVVTNLFQSKCHTYNNVILCFQFDFLYFNFSCHFKQINYMQYNHLTKKKHLRTVTAAQVQKKNISIFFFFNSHSSTYLIVCFENMWQQRLVFLFACLFGCLFVWLLANKTQQTKNEQLLFLLIYFCFYFYFILLLFCFL